MCTVHWSGSQEERRGGVAYKYGGQCRGGGFEIYVIRERSAMRSAACGSQQHVQQQLSELGIYSYRAVFPMHLKSNLPRTCEIDVRGGRARGFIHTRREFRGRMRGRGCLCVSVFIPKKHLSSILQSGVLQNESNKDEDELVSLSVFFSLYASDFLFLSLGNWKW